MAAELRAVGDNEKPFRNLGEQLLAIAIAASRPGAPLNPKLEAVQKRAQAAGASEMLPSDGGFLLAPEFSREIVERMYLTGQILRRCTKIPMTTGAIAFPQFSETSRAPGSRLGGVQFFYQNEAVSAVGVKPAFQQNQMTAKKITGLIYVTDELSRDSDALNAWAQYAFAQESTFKLEAAIVNGTGAGMPLGVLAAPALVSVAKENGQSSTTVPASTLMSTNITKMRQALWAASRPNAIWLYHGEMLPYLGSLTTEVGTAGSASTLWHWAEGDEETDRLAGIPAYPSEYCQAPGTQGDLILMDPSRYIVAMREARTDVSIHVNFLTDENVFRFVLRVDGQPIDQAAITPDHGTVATSPFVALASR